MPSPRRPRPQRPVPGDPLTGNGVTGRTLLTYADLTTGSSTAVVSDSAFALPAQAAPPTHQFQGTLTLLNTATSGGFTEIKDSYARTAKADNAWKHLPPVSATLVQNGSHLIPVQRGLTVTGGSVYNLILSPGRAWSENGDAGRTRAALPFAIVERNANCVHNGALTFVFDATTISKVRYQVTQETCAYQKFDMWGQVSATYTPCHGHRRGAGARRIRRRGGVHGCPPSRSARWPRTTPASTPASSGPGSPPPT